jgi:hemoglobin-like flavoprotein
MHRLLLVALLGAAPVLLATPAMAEDIAENHDAVGENIRAEAEAIKRLAATVKREVDDGKLELTGEALSTWDQGAALWEEITALGKAKEYGPAYKKAREARNLMRKAFREAFTGKPSAAVGDALRAYVEAVKPRVRAVEKQMENYTVTMEARESFLVAKASWDDAAKAAKKKRWDEAYRQLSDCLSELDKVIYEVYPKSR